MAALQRFQDSIQRSRAPGSVAILALSILACFVAFFTNDRSTTYIEFVGTIDEPWRLITWPFASHPLGFGFLWNVIAWAWFWWVGSALEREFGTARFVIGFLSASLMGLAFLCVGGAIFGLRVFEPATYNGLLLGDAALTVFFALKNRSAQIALFGLVQVGGPVLAGITALSVVFGYGGAYRQPMMGFFGALHLGIAAYLAYGGVPGAGRAGTSSGKLKKTEAMRPEYYADVKKRAKEREEKERLRKLFESSISDEDAPDR